MYICFVEYKIEDRYLNAYRDFMKEAKGQYSNMNIYEGTDQHGLFVELWQSESGEGAQQIKEERCSEHSSFAAVGEWISGGASKLHAWVFKPF